eukprot:3989177-Ditylum_brightwellii.AAC.1
MPAHWMGLAWRNWPYEEVYEDSYGLSAARSAGPPLVNGLVAVDRHDTHPNAASARLHPRGGAELSVETHDAGQ